MAPRRALPVRAGRDARRHSRARAAGRLAVMAAVLAAGAGPPALAPQGEGLLRGMALGLFAPPTEAALSRDLAELRALGVDAVSLVVPLGVPDVRSSTFREIAGTTPGDAAVRRAARAAHRHGMRVMLFPLLIVERLEPGEWRGAMSPPDWEEWFTRYTELVLHYARLAEEEGIALLSVGAELCSSEGRVADWHRLVGAVRQVYGGKLTYSANWDHFRHLGFAAALDYLGVNAYYKLVGEAVPAPGALTDAWGPIRDELRAWARRWDRPLLFTEVGYPSREGAATDPWDHTARRPVSLEAQRRCYRAFAEAWEGVPELGGVFFYVWWGDGGPDDAGYTPRGKPAAGEMARWFRAADASGHGGAAR